MILPPLHGSLQQSDFFIYAAADSGYFDLYGTALINSVLRNTDHGVHIHLYDPTPAQLEFCSKPRVSVTWETLMPDQFDAALAFWSRWDLPEPCLSRKNKMLGKHHAHDNRTLLTWLRKTYYASMRFVRLAEFLDQPRRFLEIDIDGIVRRPFATELDNDASTDVYVYEKTKVNPLTREVYPAGHLAGSILFTPKSQALEFVRDLAQSLRRDIESDNIYWFLDQHWLDSVIRRYRRGLLPMSMIDWKMHHDSAIWTAKGARKELVIFQQELARYR